MKAVAVLIGAAFGLAILILGFPILETTILHWG